MSNTATRLITLIMLLQRRPNQKAGDLADALGVSVRSLHRYMAALDEMGIPVYSERGPHGGFSLVRGYKMPPLVFTPDEAVAVSLGAAFVGELWGPLYAQAAQGALAKLDNVLPDEQRQEVARARQTLFTAGVNRAAVEPQAPHLALLRTALHRRVSVHLVHQGRGRAAPTERDFDPYALVHGWGWWYAVGYCHLRQEVRSFRLDRVVAVTLTEQPYTVPADFDVRQAIAFEQNAAAPVHVRLRFLPFGAHIAAYNRSNWLTYAPQDDGSVLVTFRAPDLIWASSTVLSYGSLVRVEDPPELAAFIRKEAQAILEHNTEAA